MKKQLLLVAIIAFTHLVSQAQSGVPQAMKYQSVARDKYGLEIKNTKIYLQISLGTKKFNAPKDDSTITVYYLEQHAVETNSLGLFSLSIGEGVVKQGKFDSIPWYTDDIWMNIDFREKEYQPFALISSSRLLTVPYAFHALSATHVTGIADGALANIWGLKGNTNINPETDFLGTKDGNELKFITNNIERLKIQVDGKVKINGALKVEDSLEIGGNLIAKKNVFLNTLSGETYVNGNSTFKQNVLLSNATLQSSGPTTGALVVNGGAGIGRSLYVGSAATVLDTVAFKSNAQTFSPQTGALVVTGGAGIGRSLNVGSAMTVVDTVAFKSNVQTFSPQTGALVVTGGAGIGKSLNVGSAMMVKDTVAFKSDAQTFSPQTGALVVTGGAGIGRSLNVGSAMTVVDTVAFKSVQQTYNPQTGALVVAGGAGIGKSLHVGSAMMVLDTVAFKSSAQTFSPQTGALVVTGGAGIGKSLNVGSAMTVVDTVAFRSNAQTLSPQTGALVINGGVGIGMNLNIGGSMNVTQAAAINSATQSTSTTTGALVVNGGLGIGQNLNIGGLMNVAQAAAINSATPSTSTTTGALVVNGGVGIGQNLNIGGSMNVAQATVINSATQSSSTTTGALILAGGAGIGKNVNIGEKLFVNGDIKSYSITESSGPSIGSLVVNGGIGIAKNAYIGTTLNVAGVTTLNSTLDVTNGNEYVANFTNTNASKNGINIKIKATTPNNSNDFITFRNNNDAVVGRIEGETIGELESSDDYKVDKKALDLAVAQSAIDVTTAVGTLAIATADLVASFGSSTPCVGLGVCVTAPVPSLIAAGVVNEVIAAANLVAVSIGLDNNITYRTEFVNSKKGSIGVTYQSGSADYAEWLPKANATERFRPGYIIGIKNGHISLQTDNADKILAISTKPIVLGNMPEEGKEKDYEQVAFLGQVPIHVLGKVNMGDYIVPSGHNNGFGKAIAPAKMTPSDFEKVLGMAWSASQNDVYDLINVAIGLNTGDISKVVAKQEQEIKELKTTIEDIKVILARLEAGSKAPTLPKVNPTIERTSNPINAIATNGPTKWATGTKADGSHFEAEIPDPSRILYYDITDAQIEEGVEMAMQQMKLEGVNLDTHPFWKKMQSDGSYKKGIMVAIKEKFTKQLKLHHHIDNPNKPIK